MEPQSNPYQRAIGVLQRFNDKELLDSYTRYVARLEATLGSAWLDAYAAIYQRDRRLLDDSAAGSLVLPEEIALRDRAMADRELSGLYEQIIELLKRKQLIDERYVD